MSIGKMTLALLDSDSYFGEMLSAYIRSSEYAERFSIRFFSTQTQGFRFVEDSKETLILLVHESWLPLPDAVYRLKLGCTVMISDETTTSGLLEYPVLCKYQPLDRLLSGVTAHYNEYCASKPLRGAKGTRIVAMYSAVGGAGKTVTAVHLAQQLTLQGQRVFCISFEMLPSRAWYPSMDAEGDEAFSGLLYYAKSNPQLIAAKLEKWKRKHPVLKFDYIPPAPNAAEWREMNGADACAMIQGISNAGMYDVVVVDLDSFPNDVMRRVFEAADQVLWLLLDDFVYLRKTMESIACLKQEAVEQADELLKKLSFILNKRTGEPLNDFDAMGLTVHRSLPYVPEWKAIGSVEQVNNPAFAMAAGGLLTAKGSEVALACGP